jgi:hypothetical protein
MPSSQTPLLSFRFSYAFFLLSLISHFDTALLSLRNVFATLLQHLYDSSHRRNFPYLTISTSFPSLHSIISSSSPATSPHHPPSSPLSNAPHAVQLRGIMMVGSPGVGKTYAVKAVQKLCRSWCKVHIFEINIPALLSDSDPLRKIDEVFRAASRKRRALLPLGSGVADGAMQR